MIIKEIVKKLIKKISYKSDMKKLESIKKNLTLFINDINNFDRENRLDNFLSNLTGKDIIQIVCNKGALTLAHNLVLSIEKLGLKNYILFAFDKESYNSMLSNNIQVFYDESINCDQKFGKFGTAQFKNVTNYKFVPLLKLLKKGYNVLFVDADIVFIKNPFPFFNKGFDISIQYGQGEIINEEYLNTKQNPIGLGGDKYNYLCTGFFYVQSNQRSINFFEKALQCLLDNSDKVEFDDQDAFNEVFQKNRSNIKLDVLEPYLFPNGGVFTRESKFKDMCRKDPVILHANYVFGLQNKIKLFKEIDMWHL